MITLQGIMVIFIHFFRLKRTEEAARENKTALSQLISHTKNVERAVTMSQQDILTKKETQVQK